MNHQGTVRLETNRLILRPFEASDAEGMYKNWVTDPEVTRYLTWPPHKDIEVTRAILKMWTDGYEKLDYYQWAIVLRESGEVIGSIGTVAMNKRNESCDIGNCIGKAFWGQGYMTECYGAVFDFLFNQIGFHRIQAVHHVDNLASGRVMAKAGMLHEGTMRGYNANSQGVYCDCELYGILKSDWDA